MPEYTVKSWEGVHQISILLAPLKRSKGEEDEKGRGPVNHPNIILFLNNFFEWQLHAVKCIDIILLFWTYLLYMCNYWITLIHFWFFSNYFCVDYYVGSSLFYGGTFRNKEYLKMFPSSNSSKYSSSELYSNETDLIWHPFFNRKGIKLTPPGKG